MFAVSCRDHLTVARQFPSVRFPIYHTVYSAQQRVGKMGQQIYTRQYSIPVYLQQGMVSPGAVDGIPATGSKIETHFYLMVYPGNILFHRIRLHIQQSDPFSAADIPRHGIYDRNITIVETMETLPECTLACDHTFLYRINFPLDAGPTENIVRTMEFHPPGNILHDNYRTGVGILTDIILCGGILFLPETKRSRRM